VVAAAATNSSSSSRDQPQSAELDRLETLILDVRDDTRKDVRNLQLEMMRQFRLQLGDISEVLGAFAGQMQGLVEENARLRAENERLRNVY
jgi:hypothetical protein